MNILKTLSEGATYAGHPFHIVLNYSVLLLVLVPHFFFPQKKLRDWLVLLILVTIIQVSLWFANGAVGISLIWCAMAGYNVLCFFQHRRQGAATAFLLLFSPLVAIAAMVFYYLYFPVITTIAHVSAFLLGFALGFRLQRQRNNKRNKNSLA